MKKVLSIMVAGILWLSALSTPSLAYGVPLGKLPVSKVGGIYHTFCFNVSYPFPSQTWRDTIYAGVHGWDSAGAKFLWTQTSGPTDPQGCQYEIRATHAGSGGYIAQTGVFVAYGYINTPVVTNVNVDRAWWFSQAPDSNCLTGYTCKSDLITSTRHESGHALGLPHNISPDQTYTLCQPGWQQYQVIQGCINPPTYLDPYATNVMYWLAADGFRRVIGPDDIGGIKYIYGAR